MDEGGSVMFEFAMSFPIFLTVVLMLVQWVLILNARVVVNYAAFCAARSASVIIPVKYSEQEEVNQLDPANKAGKIADIRTAAAIGCLPISPMMAKYVEGAGFDLLHRLPQPTDPYLDNPLLRVKTPKTAGDIAPTLLPEQVLQMQGKLADVLSKLADGWVGGFEKLDQLFAGSTFYQVTNKLLYSYLFTEVEIEGGPQFDEHALMTVKVTHPFHLNVPFARRVLGRRLGGRDYDRVLGIDDESRPVADFLLSKTQLYSVTITETCTIMNEGEDVNLP